MMKRLSTVQAVSILLCLVISAPSVSFSRTGTKADGAGKTLQNLPGDTLHIVVAGDLLLDRGVRQRIAQVGVDGLFTPSIDSLFLASDYVIANLECPVTAIRERVYKRFIFRGEPEWLPALHRHGITHLDLANNHSIDQGRNGLMDTQEQVRKAGMVPARGRQKHGGSSSPHTHLHTPKSSLGGSVSTTAAGELPLSSAETLCQPGECGQPCDACGPAAQGRPALLHPCPAALGMGTPPTGCPPATRGSTQTDRCRGRCHRRTPQPHASDGRDLPGQTRLLRHRQLHLRPAPTPQYTGLPRQAVHHGRQMQGDTITYRNQELCSLSYPRSHVRPLKPPFCQMLREHTHGRSMQNPV